MMKLKFISYLFLCFLLTSYNQVVTGYGDKCEEINCKISKVNCGNYFNNFFVLNSDKEVSRLKLNASFYSISFASDKNWGRHALSVPKLIGNNCNKKIIS